MRVPQSKSPIPAARPPAGSRPRLRVARPLERRHHLAPPGSDRGGGFYIPLKLRVGLTVLAGLTWVCFSLWLSRAWISTLGHEITLPLAIVVIVGIALIPGYLNIQLLSSILLDRPRLLRFDVNFPEVTLLIAAFNEQSSITETLDYALRADYPGPFDVVVVDDGSSDRTREIVSAYAARDARVRLLAVEHGGKANALNAALATVTAPLVATIDADTLLMPYSLKRAVARMLVSPPDTVAVAGAVLVRNSRVNLLTRAQEWDYFLGIASVKRGQALLQGTLVAQGAFSVYDGTALRLAGGWPDKIGEDIVLTWRMLLQGGRCVFEPTAVAFTEAPSSWGAFVRQRRRWARGMIEGLRDHGFGLLKRLDFYSHSVAGNFMFPLLDATFTLAFLPGIVLAATGNFAIVGPMTVMVLPLNAALGGVMLLHQRRVFSSVNLKMRNNRRGLFFYFFCYQFVMSPISLSGYLLEMFRARRAW
ncbi:MAG: poly-beta,6-N-acetyl-D-glucosamine synthase [Solirubrobacteraceae bacterium]|jgi:biofilm PGA synthesis N-glycosyltransferase PgaC|nr:poly-beta,6-N-acetyl-D-glucosamine synthase [Solirubrobacteraceae bacterium]